MDGPLFPVAAIVQKMRQMRELRTQPPAAAEQNNSFLNHMLPAMG